MARDETALVLVLPEDGADVILAKLRASGARSVQLLVSEGAVALRRPDVAARIGDLAVAEGVDVTLISSDRPTIEAARAGGIQTLLVPDARVLAPTRSVRSDRPATPYSTNVIERRQGQAQPPRAPAPPRPEDAALDNFDAPPPTRPGEAADEDLDAALAGLSAALDNPGRGRVAPLSDEEILAASLDSTPPRGQMRPKAAATTAGSLGRIEPAPRPVPRDTPSSLPVPLPQPRRDAPARRRAWPIAALVLLLLLLLGGIGGLWLWNSRVTVAVTAPVRSEDVTPFEALAVPITATASEGGTAVIAEPLSSDVAASQEGEVTEGTLTPSGTASGVVTVRNSSSQAILLSAGTEFIAVKADGQEVPFISSAEALVPGATTADQGAQIITTRGEAQVPVSARSPGSGSNVDANTVRRITPPGGASFNLGPGGLSVFHDPLAGGSEQEVRVIKDSDVQRLLAPALEALDAEARRQLDGLAQARGLAVDASTISPQRAELEQLQGFDTMINPPVGSTLDANSPRFTLTVQAAYSALATPADRPLDQQLGPVVTEQLRRAGQLQPGDCRAPSVTAWRWDGQGLLVDGRVAPDTQSPRCQGGLDDAALAQVREAVRGKSRAEAEAALQALVAEGVIGSYTLPDTASLPSWDWQLTVTGQ